MKADIEMLNEYIEKTDKGFYESLSDPEKILYQCVIRDSLEFAWYVFRKRCEELGTLLKQAIKKFRKRKTDKKSNIVDASYCNVYIRLFIGNWNHME